MFKTKRARADKSGQEGLRDVHTERTEENGDRGPTASAAPGAEALRSKVPSTLTPKRRQTEPPDGATIRQQFEAVKRYAAEPRAGFSPEPHRSSAEEPSRLMIGRDITFKGEIGRCRTLVVEGKVAANAKCETLQVQEKGNFEGEIEAETAEICGRIDGRIKVRGRLTIRTAGQVSGDVTYGELDIAAGGRLTGKIVHESTPEQTAPPERTAKPKQFEVRVKKSMSHSVPAATVDNAPTALPAPPDLDAPRSSFDPVSAAGETHSESADDSETAKAEADPAAPKEGSDPIAVGAAGVRP